MAITKHKKALLAIIIAVLLVAGLVWLIYRNNAPYPNDPFAGVSADDFVEISLLEGHSVLAVLTEEECAELIPLLLQVKLYGQPEKIKPEDWAGGISRMFRITLTGKEPFVFSEFGGSYLLDGNLSFSKHHNYELGQSLEALYAAWYFHRTGHSHVG